MVWEFLLVGLLVWGAWTLRRARVRTGRVDAQVLGMWSTDCRLAAERRAKARPRDSDPPERVSGWFDEHFFI